MDKLYEGANLRRPKYGDGKSIIEILNIGFEPLLTEKEYKIYKEIGKLKKQNYSAEHGVRLLKKDFLPIDDLCELETDSELIEYYLKKQSLS